MGILVSMNLPVHDFAKKMIIGVGQKIMQGVQVGQGSRRSERSFFLNRNLKQRALLRDVRS